MKRLDRISKVLAQEKYRVILTQAISNPEILKALEKIGFNTKMMEEGSNLIERARDISDANHRKKNELAFAYANFTKRKKEVERTFKDHRSKARLLISKVSLEADKLVINGPYPVIYEQWVESVRRFYSVAAEDQEIQSTLLRLRLLREEIIDGLVALEEVEDLRAEYVRHKGDSRLLTAEKNEAFQELHDWMKLFFGAARLALREKPELLAALERHVA